jgi:hypothetical protein
VTGMSSLASTGSLAGAGSLASTGADLRAAFAGEHGIAERNRYFTEVTDLAFGEESCMWEVTLW